MALNIRRYSVVTVAASNASLGHMGSVSLCLFEVQVLSHKDDLGLWNIKVTKPLHNHEPSKPISHPVHQKMALTDKVMERIENAARTLNEPAQIIRQIRRAGDEENPIFKPRDIYNARANIEGTKFQNMTLIQALIKYRETFSLSTRNTAIISSSTYFSAETPLNKSSSLTARSSLLTPPTRTIDTSIHWLPSMVLHAVMGLKHHNSNRGGPSHIDCLLYLLVYRAFSSDTHLAF